MDSNDKKLLDSLKMSTLISQIIIFIIVVIASVWNYAFIIGYITGLTSFLFLIICKYFIFKRFQYKLKQSKWKVLLLMWASLLVAILCICDLYLINRTFLQSLLPNDKLQHRDLNYIFFCLAYFPFFSGPLVAGILNLKTTKRKEKNG